MVLWFASVLGIIAGELWFTLRWGWVGLDWIFIIRRSRRSVRVFQDEAVAPLFLAARMFLEVSRCAPNGHVTAQSRVHKGSKAFYSQGRKSTVVCVAGRSDHAGFISCRVISVICFRAFDAKRAPTSRRVGFNPCQVVVAFVFFPTGLPFPTDPSVSHLHLPSPVAIDTLSHYRYQGSSPDASAETLPSAEGRENNAAVEEEWGARAVAALKEPLPDARYASLSSSSSSSSSSSPLPSSADIVIDTDGGVADGRGGGGGDEGVGDSGAGAREGATDGELTLLLACLCRGLGTTFVVRLPEILNR